MLFVEARFFFFFACVFGIAWSLRSNRLRKAFLLFCSYFFYACFFVGDPVIFARHLAAGEWAALPEGWWFPFVLFGSTCLDYFVGRILDQTESPLARRGLLLVSLTVNLGTLSVFKY